MVKPETVLPSRFQVWLVNLDPTQGREINKIRLCVIISPDEMSSLSTVIAAPMTTKGFDYPSRVRCRFQDKKELILLDQIRALDKSRLVKHMDDLDTRTQANLCNKLVEMFTL